MSASARTIERSSPRWPSIAPRFAPSHSRTTSGRTARLHPTSGSQRTTSRSCWKTSARDARRRTCYCALRSCRPIARQVGAPPGTRRWLVVGWTWKLSWQDPEGSARQAVLRQALGRRMLQLTTQFSSQTMMQWNPWLWHTRRLVPCFILSVHPHDWFSDLVSLRSLWCSKDLGGSPCKLPVFF